jgi:phosphoglycerate-specific signal transduction histidine kinase
MYILKFVPKSVEGMTLGLFICKSIVEDNEMRKTRITLNSNGAEAFMVVFKLNMPLNSYSRRQSVLKGIS